ncbi:MAG: N-acetylmuramoyl-L-alanine amidase [Butyricicoccus pullicaecorum]|nr:N-acetylmuramoyl-L-alanine amidase [Butyricicoccus pullicaecorum]
MKRLVAGILTAALLTSAAGAVSYDPEAAGTSAPAATTVSETVSESVMAASLTAYPATMTVMLDGKQVKPVGYNINGNKYYKLRDIALILNGTTAQFGVSWDKSTRSMNLTPGSNYEAVGGELGAIPTKNATAQTSNETVLINGIKASLTAYNVDGYNYFKLVDLGDALGFDVGYESKTRTVLITTPTVEQPTPETPEETPEEPETPAEPEPTPSVSAIDGKLKIWIDPGHGGTDSGNVATSAIPFDDYWGVHHDGNTKIYEKDFNLAVSLMLRDKLESAGVEVRMTRDDDSTVDATTRKQLFSTEGGGYDMIFSVHQNGYSTSTPKGSELLIQIAYEDGGAGQEFGDLLKQEYTSLGQDWRRFVFQRSGSDPSKDYYFVLRSAQEGGALAFISEFCFMSNADDQLGLLYTENLDKQATAQYNAIMKYFETHPY